MLSLYLDLCMTAKAERQSLGWLAGWLADADLGRRLERRTCWTAGAKYKITARYKSPRRGFLRVLCVAFLLVGGCFAKKVAVRQACA